MDRQEAQRVLDSLRKGIPPDGFIGHFTVGRHTEIKQLTTRLRTGEGGTLLLKANYGSGKSHLLRFVRETALQEGYAVSSVTLDAKSAVRFNRMDQIMAAIWRGMEVPDHPGLRGPEPFISYVVSHLNNSIGSTRSPWFDITNRWAWDNPNFLGSGALYTVLRAWARGHEQDKIVDWLQQPWTHNTNWLVEYTNKRTSCILNKSAFNFVRNDYEQSWAMLRAMDTIAHAADLKGLVILFDEFEDVFNLNNGNSEVAAFANLFEFYLGRQYTSTSYFAITPAFVDKCKARLVRRGNYDFDTTQFDRLPTFVMSPLERNNLEELTARVRKAHGIAYDWQPDDHITEKQMLGCLDQAIAVPVQDRARHAVKAIVEMLDETLQELE